MIRPAVSTNASHAGTDALLKRSVFIVVTKKFVYFRPDGVNEDPVERIAVDHPDFLTADGKEFYGMFKSNNKTIPPNFDTEVKKEQAWISAIMAKCFESRRPDSKNREKMREALWGSSSRPSTCLEKAHAKASAEDGLEERKHSIPYVKMESQE